MVNVNNRPGTYQETYLKNETTAISDAAQGKRKGIIAGAEAQWSDAPPVEGEEGNSEEGIHYQYSTNLKGEWLGQGRETSSFQPTELNFESQQSSKKAALRQKITMGFETGNSSVQPIIPGVQTQAPNSVGNHAIPGKVSAEVEITFKDSEGSDYLDLLHKQNFFDGHTSDETSASLQVTETLELNGSFAREDAHSSTTTLGAAFAPELEDHVFNLGGEVSCAGTEEDKTHSMNTTVVYDSLNASYSRETTSQRELMDGVEMAQIQELINVNYTLLDDDLSLGYTENSLLMRTPDYTDQGQAVAGDNETRSRELSVSYQASEAIQLGITHGVETVRSSATPEDNARAEYTTLSLQQKLNETWSGKLEFTHKARVADLFSLKLNYQEAETELSLGTSKWEMGYDRENSLVDPALSNQRYNLAYSATEVQEMPLAMDCRFSYQTFHPASLTQDKWEGSIRLYGHGQDALPVEAKLDFSSDSNRSMMASLNYFYEF